MSLAFPVSASNWTRLTEAGNTTFYFDKLSIHRAGDLRNVWEMHDLKIPRADGTASISGWREYDCKNERVRSLKEYTHTRNMASGKATDTLGGKPAGWTKINHGTAGWAYLKLLC